jgi:hypothetical protein
VKNQALTMLARSAYSGSVKILDASDDNPYADQLVHEIQRGASSALNHAFTARMI